MIPIGDDNSGRQSFPFVNIVLILINIVAFVYQLSLLATSPQALERFVAAYGAVPAELTTGTDLPPQIGIPVYLTIFTSMFLHGGFLHILGNMWYLWIFGDNVEDTMGHFRYLIFYLLGGIAAAVAQTVTAPSSEIPMVGASGAISAVMGAYLVLFPGGQVRTLAFLGWIPLIFYLPALILIGLWFVFQFFAGIASLGVETAPTGGVAYWAHIGGFIAGMLLVWFFRNPERVERQRAARRAHRAFQRAASRW
ncbi:rhomboid family intramembrane serine protease [Thermomicrobiaceae bacterium CFH 74404]|uniref:Rhomboid family intramembrane serine protease n=1 Tax=Thermalbibacter longus TaxID=2951981 RepID=A0AA41WGB6_9BACT|nr:rhomboid family intramembrane serine protease [Thermalbibacter longus]MCM8750069.1 rhomboid family intramembrane serine protease [Thermalbibacter longus]